MRQFVLDLLKQLEREIPPNYACHHALMYCRYGSDADGWEDKLALQVISDGVSTNYFIEPEDEGKSPDAIVADILKLRA